MDLGGRSPLSNLLMLFYENTPAWQESYNSYATNATCVGTKFSYNIPTHPDAAIAVLHAKIERLLLLLEDQQNDEYAGLIGTMDTRDAAAFIAISKRTFERKVKEGLISPIAKNMKKNKFSKQDVVRLYIAYRGYRPTHLP